MNRFYLFIPLMLTLLFMSQTVASAATLVRVKAPTVALQNPGFGKKIRRIPTTTPYGHDQLALRVLSSVDGIKEDGTSVTYYKVHIPFRRSRLDSSNGHVGWVSSDMVQVFSTPYTVTVNTKRHRLILRRNGKVWKQWPIVNGATGTPTPKGKFAIYGKTSRSHSFDGAGIMPFAYSPVWAQFDGGNGMVALHGRSGASLRTPLGTAGSNGCVRMNNDKIKFLLNRLPIGTPVDVV